MIRRFGESPEAGRTYTRRVGVYSLLPQGSRLLLTCQLQPGPDLQLPGGGIDPGESAITALHREVYEETGWLIAAPRRVGAFRRYAYMPEYDMWAEKICLIYRARPVRRIGPPTEAFHEVLWMETDDAVHFLGNEGDAYFAQRHLRGLC